MAWLLCIALLDLAAGTVVYVRVSEWSRITDLPQHVARVDVADLWVGCLLRSALVVAAVAVLLSPGWRRVYSQPRARRTSQEGSVGIREPLPRRGCPCWGGRKTDKHAAKHYLPKKKDDERVGAEQEETFMVVVMLVTLVLVTGVLVKISFLACFADEISEGVQWRWAAAAQGIVFAMTEFFLLRRRVAASADAFASSGGADPDVLHQPLLSPADGEAQDGLLPAAASSASLVSMGSGSTASDVRGSTADSQHTTEGGREGAGGGGGARKSKSKGMLRLCSLALEEWPYLMAAVVFLLLAAGAQAIIPKVTGEVINAIVLEKSPERVHDSLLLLTSVSLACALFSGMRGSCFIMINTKMNVRIRDRLFSAIMAQEIGFFDVTKTGEITSRLSADVNKMSDQIGLNVNVCLRSVVQAATLLAFMLASQWQLTVVTFVSVPLVSIVSKVYGSFYKKLTVALQDQQAVCNANAEELIASMRTVRSFGAEAQEMREYRGGLQLLLSIGFRQVFICHPLPQSLRHSLTRARAHTHTHEFRHTPTSATCFS